MAAVYGSDGEGVGARHGDNRESSAPATVDVTALHREHFLHLTRLAAMLVGDRETAEDIVQDVFTKMQNRWRRFPDPDRALRYVRASVVNGARTALRRRRTAERHQVDPPTDQPPAEQVALAQLADDSLRATVGRLPRRQREVILLRYLEDLSVTETAAVLGISPGAVKSSAGRGIAGLAAMLGVRR